MGTAHLLHGFGGVDTQPAHVAVNLGLGLAVREQKRGEGRERFAASLDKPVGGHPSLHDPSVQVRAGQWGCFTVEQGRVQNDAAVHADHVAPCLPVSGRKPDLWLGAPWGDSGKGGAGKGAVSLVD